MVETARPAHSSGDGSELQRLLDAQRDERILVAIAADSAAVAGAAVSEAFDQATRPDRVRVAVAVPTDRSSDPALDGRIDDPRVTIDKVQVGHPAAGGSGAATARLRSAARGRYDGEPSVVLVDGPVRFESGWDEWVVATLQLADADRPVIDLAGPASASELERVARRRLVGVVAPGRLCVETPVDDEDHDGSRLALRAYTHGYDCFATDAVLVRMPASSDEGGTDEGGTDEGGTDEGDTDEDDTVAAAQFDIEAVDGVGGFRTVEAFRRLLDRADATREPG